MAKQQTKYQTEYLQIDQWQVELIRSDRRRSLSIEINHGGLRARAPMRMREKTIVEFIKTKQSWINRHLDKMAPRPEKIRLENGITLPYLNQNFELVLLANRRGKGYFKDQRIVLPMTASQMDNELSAKNKLVRWYRQEAQNLLRDKVAHYLQQFNLTKRGLVKVREYKSRWGSCEHNGNLSFNWRIIMAPESVIDYVVIHELAHLIEFNHSKRFWRIVEQHMPDWKSQQQWLADNGAQLYRI